MSEAHNKLAQLLNVQPEVLLAFDERMAGLTGKTGVLDKIAAENNASIEKVMKKAGLNHWADVKTVYGAASSLILKLDGAIKNLVGAKDGVDFVSVSGKLCETASAFSGPKRGLFIKKEKARELLKKVPPKNIIEYFGFSSVDELLEHKELEPILCALRFAEDEGWMHSFFDQAYGSLSADDFEEREVKVVPLGAEWIAASEKFYKKKFHNVSHLKELGIIFVYPFAENVPGSILRAFIMVLHYLNEVPFYANVIRRIAAEDGFIENLKSLLRGDVPQEQPIGEDSYRIVQRYLYKVNSGDPRLFEPHFNPEAEHWSKTEEDLAKVGTLPDIQDPELFAIWRELGPVGDKIEEASVSFNLEDLSFSLANAAGEKYFYHQQEALWNKIFIEYLGRDKMDELISKNLTRGFFSVNN